MTRVKTAGGLLPPSKLYYCVFKTLIDALTTFMRCFFFLKSIAGIMNGSVLGATVRCGDAICKLVQLEGQRNSHATDL